MRVHVLHHAANQPTFGLEMMEELKRHGYEVSAGTLYPMLHSLQAAGVLRSKRTLVNGKSRKYYRTTKAGDALLVELRTKVSELVAEVLQIRVSPRRRNQ
jgi:DNA-binding PadR family transcriptional regulator